MGKTVLQKNSLTLVVLLLLSLAPVAAYTSLEIEYAFCSNDGSLMLGAWNGRPEPLYTEDVIVVLRNLLTNEMILPQGQWNKEMVWNNVHDREQKEATYTALPASVNQSGNYRITIAYPGCSRVGCETHFNLDDCQGYRPKCIAREPMATTCTITDKSVILDFTIPDPIAAFTVHPNQDIVYYLVTNFDDRKGVTTIPGALAQRTSNITFQTMIPLRHKENISYAAIAIKGCESTARWQRLVSCVPAEPTITVVTPETALPVIKPQTSPEEFPAVSIEEGSMERIEDNATIDAVQSVKAKASELERQLWWRRTMIAILVIIISVFLIAILFFRSQTRHRHMKR